MPPVLWDYHVKGLMVTFSQSWSVWRQRWESITNQRNLRADDLRRRQLLRRCFTNWTNVSHCNVNSMSPSVSFSGKWKNLFSGTSYSKMMNLISLKGLCHGQKCLHLFSDSEAYHEQICPIPSSSGRLI